jgi:hypothetical protein
LGFDVTIEVGLSLGAQPTSIDRLNTLWWVLALFRLISGAAIRMPVISNILFAVIPTTSLEPTLWTIEMLPRQLRMMKKPPVEISLTLLEWVRDVLVPGATLLNDSNFSRAFQTFDGAIWLRSLGSAILMVWASIETLFRPGRRNITKILAASVASFLFPPGPERDRAYNRVAALYEARGNAAHDAQIPESEQLFESFDVGRRTFAKCLELGQTPDCNLLMANWKGKV